MRQRTQLLGFRRLLTQSCAVSRMPCTVALHHHRRPGAGGRAVRARRGERGLCRPRAVDAAASRGARPHGDHPQSRPAALGLRRRHYRSVASRPCGPSVCARSQEGNPKQPVRPQWMVRRRTTNCLHCTVKRTCLRSSATSCGPSEAPPPATFCGGRWSKLPKLC